MKTTLILGGTTEASALAGAMAAAGLPAVLSYAGRVESPRPQPVPVRLGGFGGIEGLADYLQKAAIGQVVDATHPFAAQISANALAACALAGVPLCAFERPPWQAGPGDDWHGLPDLQAAVVALAGPGRRVFLAIGRQHLTEFAGLPQHEFLLRLVDPPASLPLANARVVVARGPFTPEQDLALLRQHRIEVILCKNAGGQGAEAKLQAARQLGLPVLMIDRPGIAGAKQGGRLVLADLSGVLDWLHARLGV